MSEYILFWGGKKSDKAYLAQRQSALWQHRLLHLMASTRPCFAWAWLEIFSILGGCSILYARSKKMFSTVNSRFQGQTITTKFTHKDFNTCCSPPLFLSYQRSAVKVEVGAHAHPNETSLPLASKQKKLFSGTCPCFQNLSTALKTAIYSADCDSLLLDLGIKPSALLHVLQ